MGCVQQKQKFYKPEIAGFKPTPPQFPEHLKKTKEDCSKYYINQYQLYLSLKLDLQYIKHRKVVHKIYQKYLPQPQQKLVLDCKGIRFNEFFDLKTHYNSIMQVPFQAKNLKLDISLSYFLLPQDCKYKECFQKQRCLLQLDLNLQKLAGFHFPLQYLCESLQELPYLQHLILDLSLNPQLGKDFDQFGIYMQVMNNLENLELILQNINIESKDYGLFALKSVFQKLPNLQSLKLDLSDNQLGTCPRDFKWNYLVDSLKELPKLRYLDLDLSDNTWGQNLEKNHNSLQESLQQLARYKKIILKINLQ